jgi:hypothetical protein
MLSPKTSSLLVYGEFTVVGGHTSVFFAKIAEKGLRWARRLPTVKSQVHQQREGFSFWEDFGELRWGIGMVLQ